MDLEECVLVSGVLPARQSCLVPTGATATGCHRPSMVAGAGIPLGPSSGTCEHLAIIGHLTPKLRAPSSLNLSLLSFFMDPVGERNLHVLI